MEVFWNTIAEYNAATWIWQIAWVVIGAILTLLLYFPPDTRGAYGHESLYGGAEFLDSDSLLHGILP